MENDFLLNYLSELYEGDDKAQYEMTGEVPQRDA